MVEATNHYVQMDELMEAVGQRLAELTGAEWGYITSGCAAAMAQIAAACVAGADPERMARLPNTAGMADEVIVQKAHRNVYDHALRMVGAEMVEVVTQADLEAAISERTAMFYLTGTAHARGEIPMAEMIEFGQRHGIPSLVDAAAERPDVPNRYLELGADAVAYSGGKCLRGPQASGLVLGRKDLLQAAFLNGAPHHSFGRPMKAGKEEVMGLLAAVEAWVEGRNHQAEWECWEGILEHIASAIEGIPSVQNRVVPPSTRNNVTPTLSIWWDEDVVRISPTELRRELEEGDPRIALGMRDGNVFIMPYMMEEGEERVVAQRLQEVLQGASRREPSQPVEKAPVQVAGNWTVAIRYLLGESQHSVSFEQDGSRLTGHYRSRYAESAIEGFLDGGEIVFRTVIGHQASRIPYTFSGQVEGECITGQVDLAEYWAAPFSAVCVD
jgi:L-seryl-tRNA(Ser) seleniumtransferase